MNFIVLAGYTPDIDLKETQIAIKVVKDFFQKELTKQLNLTRVSAPLFVTPESGLGKSNDPGRCHKHRRGCVFQLQKFSKH